jgi:hypothetical protein
MLALARGAYTIAGFDDDVFAQVHPPFRLCTLNMAYNIPY